MVKKSSRQVIGVLSSVVARYMDSRQCSTENVNARCDSVSVHVTSGLYSRLYCGALKQIRHLENKGYVW